MRGLECDRGGCACHAATRHGKGLTHCPAHDDHTPSLSVWETADGPAWSCKAGCEWKTVTHELESRGLVHTVRDRDGHVDGYHERKGRWARADGRARLDRRRPTDMLYGAELLAKRPTDAVWIAEGEKAAEALRSLGLLAVGTVCGAASTPTADALSVLAGRDVVLWPDADDQGIAHMARIAERLAGTAFAVRIVHWPDAPAKGDAADFVAARGTAEMALALVAPVASSDIAEPVEPPPSVPEFPLDTLPAAARAYVERQAERGLPTALLACAALGTLAGAIGGSSVLRINEAWSVRAILWIGLVAASGVGKSPSLLAMLQPLQELQAERANAYRAALATWRDAPKADRGPRPVMQRHLIDDTTIETLARQLDHDPDALLTADELRGLLKSLGQYKAGGGSDLDRLLTLWTGSAWSYQRSMEGLTIYIEAPTLSVLGGIQPSRLPALGNGEDGLRARWLLVRVDAEAPRDDERLFEEATAELARWARLIGHLFNARDQERTWTLGVSAKVAFQQARARWRRMGVDPAEPDHVADLARKADLYALRLALVLAEALRADVDASVLPLAGVNGIVDLDAMRRAVLLVDYFLAQRRVLDFPQLNLLATLRDRDRDQAVTAFLVRLSAHPKGRMTARDIQRGHVAGVRTVTEAGSLLERYGETYSGCLVEEKTTRGLIKVAYHPSKRPGASKTDPSGANVADDANVAAEEVCDTDDSYSEEDEAPPPPTDDDAPLNSDHDDNFKGPGDIGVIGDIGPEPDATRHYMDGPRCPHPDCGHHVTVEPGEQMALCEHCRAAGRPNYVRPAYAQVVTP